MHNYNVNTYLLPRKLALPSWGGVGGGYASSGSPPWEGPGEALQVSTPLPWGGVGGGYLLNSFTNAFAGRGVLKNKNVAVENTRVLSLVGKLLVVKVLHEMNGEKAFSQSDYFAISVKTACNLHHITVCSDAECTVT